MRRKIGRIFALLLIGLCVSAGTVYADKKPNILVIMGDDIGITNISSYSHGLMGSTTTNIDKLAKEGLTFTDYYGEQSCTAGRSAFITGQNPFRVGLTKVGMPGAKQGLSDKDPTIAGRCSSPMATCPGNSARITWAIATSICLQYTVSTSMPACSIT